MPQAEGKVYAEGGAGWLSAARRWVRGPLLRPKAHEPALGLALGGGFARGIAHVGVLRVFERENIPIRFVSGVSAGAMVAAAFASGASSHEIELVARSMKFRDVARWTVSRLGLAGSERMAQFLQRLLKVHAFEEMRIPLAVIATDLGTGKPIVFRGKGDVTTAIRASCSYPGLFRPVRDGGRYLVDGAMSMEVPAEPLRRMGATHVISVFLPCREDLTDPSSMFGVVNRCFQILQRRTEREWRLHSDVVLAPDAKEFTWDSFGSTEKLIEAGEKAAEAAVPWLRHWLARQPRAGEGSRQKPDSGEVKKPVTFLQSPA